MNLYKSTRRGLIILGLVQTGDKSPYYKQTYFGRRWFSEKQSGSQ